MLCITSTITYVSLRIVFGSLSKGLKDKCNAELMEISCGLRECRRKLAEVKDGVH